MCVGVLRVCAEVSLCAVLNEKNINLKLACGYTDGSSWECYIITELLKLLCPYLCYLHCAPNQKNEFLCLKSEWVELQFWIGFTTHQHIIYI